MTEGLEAELRARFDVREERFAHGGWSVELILPRAADELIDEAEFAGDERLPYWAELWPSARGLARHLLDAPPPVAIGGGGVEGGFAAADGVGTDAVGTDVVRTGGVGTGGGLAAAGAVGREGGAGMRDDGWAGVRVLELGCGVALPSLALRGRGAEVLATDWYPEALRFAEANAARNGLAPVRTALLDWRHPPDAGGYDVVIAADVLYESRNVAILGALLPRVTAPGGTVLVADPGRIYAGDFLQAMREDGWTTEEADVRVEPSALGAQSRVRIHRLRRVQG